MAALRIDKILVLDDSHLRFFQIFLGFGRSGRPYIKFALRELDELFMIHSPAIQDLWDRDLRSRFGDKPPGGLKLLSDAAGFKTWLDPSELLVAQLTDDGQSIDLRYGATGGGYGRLRIDFKAQTSDSTVPAQWAEAALTRISEWATGSS
ncbi:MAG: hypothetical protein JO211_01040 [Acidobacteriaceae bacterium]|nr:hypothetical protein [Acidobacteriaceae bacterium]